MKKLQIFLVFIVIVVVAAVFTNPNEKKHKEALKAKLKTHIQEYTDREDFMTRSLGMLLGGAAVDQLVDSYITTENYIIFSKTILTINGKKKEIGVGFLGNVYPTKKIDEVLTEELSQIRL
ncbi:MAG: hypothetical protein LBV71_05500 [Prevotella sp.]|jgi:hypothetical protein|nr:hypothetical protein [Prevotella sp.]